MVIIVTGTPGTGKTKIAKAIAQQMNLKYLDVNQVIDKHNLVEKYDTVRKTNIVDEKKLVKILIKIINEDNKLVIDSHLSHEIPSKYIDLCIVTKCKLKELKKRLEKRKYSESKVRENMDAEIFDICLNEAKEMQHKLLILDTTNKDAKNIIKNLIK